MGRTPGRKPEKKSEENEKEVSCMQAKTVTSGDNTFRFTFGPGMFSQPFKAKVVKCEYLPDDIVLMNEKLFNELVKNGGITKKD